MESPILGSTDLPAKSSPGTDWSAGLQVSTAVLPSLRMHSANFVIWQGLNVLLRLCGQKSCGLECLLQDGAFSRQCAASFDSGSYVSAGLRNVLWSFNISLLLLILFFSYVFVCLYLCVDVVTLVQVSQEAGGIVFPLKLQEQGVVSHQVGCWSTREVRALSHESPLQPRLLSVFFGPGMHLLYKSYSS